VAYVEIAKMQSLSARPKANVKGKTHFKGSLGKQNSFIRDLEI